MPRRFQYILAILLLLNLLAGGCLKPPAGQVSNTGVPFTGLGPIDSGWKIPGNIGSAPALPDMVAVVNKVRASVVSINIELLSGNGLAAPKFREGAGSGWIIDSSGLIVTNNHVIQGANTVQVSLSDGRIFPAKQINADAFSDIAVIKIDASDLTAAQVGDSSKLQVGALVAAMGNALGEGIAMTGGWVSRLGASITLSQSQSMYDLIETDAAINPGNSGGPLINLAGEVIGITNAKIVSPEISGVGYAISMSNALPVIEALIVRGTVIRPYFGVSLQTVNAAVASRYGLGVRYGALITQIGSGSPADQAGLRRNDVIVSIDGKRTNSASEVVTAIQNDQIGQQISVTYYRGAASAEVSVTLVQRQ